MPVTLTLDLSKSQVPTEENQKQLATYDANTGLTIKEQVTYYANLDRAGFDSISGGDVVNGAGSGNGYTPVAYSQSYANYRDVYLPAGAEVSITYRWLSSATNAEEWSWAALDRTGEPTNCAAFLLANSAVKSRVNGTDGTVYTSTIKDVTAGTYNLAVGVSRSNYGSTDATLVVQAISITYPDSIYTTGPDGIHLAGALLGYDGKLSLANGADVSPAFSNGALNVLADVGNHGNALVAAGGGNLVAAGGGNFVTSEGSNNLVAAGGGNLVAAGGGNLVAAGGGNLVAAGGGNLVAAGGGNLVAAGGGNILASNSNGLVAAGGGNVIITAGNAYKQLSAPPPAAPPAILVDLSAPNALGSDIQIGETGPAGTSQADPAVAGLSTGGFAVAWAAQPSTSTSSRLQVRAQVLGADGTAVGPSFAVSTDTNSDQSKVSVTGLADGHFVVSWEGTSFTAGKKDPDLHFQLFDESGAKIGSETRVGFGQDPFSPDPSHPRDLIESNAKVASLSDGGFVLTFQEQDNGPYPSNGIALRYDSAGHLMTSIGLSGVLTVGDASSGKSTQVDLAATGLADGGFAVAYRQTNPDAADKEGIYLDVIGSDGTTTQSQIHVNSLIPGYTPTGSGSDSAMPGIDGLQKEPAVATLTNGNVVVTWIDSGDAKGKNLGTLRAQIVNPTTGDLVGSEITIANTLAGGTPPAVTALHDGGFNVTWNAPTVQAATGDITGLYLQSQSFNADGSHESPIFTISTPSSSGAYREGSPAVTQLADDDLIVVGSKTVVGGSGVGNTSTIQGNFFSTTGQTSAANNAPSGTDGTVTLFRDDYDDNQNVIYRHTFDQADFGFTDPDQDALSGVTITTLPAGGGLTLNGTAVTAGQFISVDDINYSKLVYKTTSTVDHTFTFQVHDTGDSGYGGQDTDSTPNTLTLHVNALPVFHNVPAAFNYTPGQAKPIASGITITDADDTTLYSAQVSFSPEGYLDGDTLSATTTGTNITATFDAQYHDLDLSGTDTLAHYQQVLESVTYAYTGSAAATGAGDDRTVFWFVTDSHGAYNTDNNEYSYTTISSLHLSVSTSPASGVLGIGKTLSITVSTDGHATTVTGAPSLSLNDGGMASFNRTASDLAHGKVVFTYTVGITDSSTDHLAITGLNIPAGASIKVGTATVDASAIGTVPLPVAVDTIQPAAPDSPNGAPTLSAASDTGVLDDGVTKITTPTFTGTAEAGATVTLYDGTKLVGTGTATNSGTYSITTSALANGAHTIFAKATDAAGNSSQLSVGRPITIDTTAPAAPSTPKFVAGYDTGVSATDGLTNVPNPAVMGTAEKGSTIQLYVNEGATGYLVGSTTVDGNGNYAVYSNRTFGQGAYTIQVTATDAAGNVSAPSAAIPLTIDTLPPADPSRPVLATASDTGGSTSDGFTKDNTPTVSGTAEAGAIVTLYDGTKAVGSTLATNAGAYTITSSALSDGAHALTAIASDKAGNESAATSPLNITVRAKAVIPTAPKIDAASDTGASSSDGVTSDTTPMTVSGTADLGAKVTIYDGSKTLGTVTADGTTGVYSLALTAPFAEGSHALKAVATDLAGNAAATSAVSTIIIDTKAPTAAPTVPALAKGSDTGKSTTDLLTKLTMPTFTGKAEAGSTVTLYDGMTAIGSGVTSTSGVYTITTTALADGAHTVTATVADKAGNAGPASATGTTINIDSATPAAPTAVALATASDTGAQDGVTKVSKPTVQGNAEAGSTVTLYDGVKIVGTGAAATDGSFSIVASTLADGAHVLTATATDAAGNASAATQLQIFVEAKPVTPSAPKVAAADDHGISSTDNITNDTAPTIVGTAAAKASVSLYDGTNTTAIATTTADQTGAYTFADVALAAGSHVLKAVATDLFNSKTSSATRTVVIDTSVPTANDDNVSYTSATKAPLTIAGATLAKNDINSDKGDALSLKAVDPADPTHGHVTFSNGNAVYTPDVSVFTIATGTGSTGLTDSFAETIQDKAGNTSDAHVKIALTGKSVAPTGTATMTAGADDVVLDLDNLKNVTSVAANGTVAGITTINTFDTAQDHLITFAKTLAEFAPSQTYDAATTASLGDAAGKAAQAANAAHDNAIFFEYANSTYLLSDHGTAGSFGKGDGLVKFANVGLPASDGLGWHMPMAKTA